ncbi:MAG: hypothetical protein IJ612_04775 [Prevotella sp.]|nr:hypothetical protein [Prevotella sp.]
MKKLLSLLAVAMMAVCAFAQQPPLRSLGEQTFTYDFENNNGNWTIGEGANFAAGNITDPLVVGELELSNVQGEASQPARLMRANDGVNALYVYAKGAIKLADTEERAITKIVVTMKTGSFDLTPSNGTVTENVWEGNATEVKFTASASRQILNITVTTNKKDGETWEPQPEVFDLEVASIAEFNAVDDGKAVKLTLTDARVNGTFNGYYVEDATGATVFKNVNLTAGTKLNGYIIGTKSTNTNIDYMNDPAKAVEYQLTAAESSEPTFTETATTLKGTLMTISEAATQANYARLITLQNVAISGTGQNKTLTDAEGNTIMARDYMGVLPEGYTWPEQATEITGVLIYYMTGWFIMPISAAAIVEASAITFDFANNNMDLPQGTGNDDQGNLGGKAITQGNVTLTFVNTPTMPTRYYVNGTRGPQLQLIKGGQMRVSAAEGQAITAITVTPNVTTNTSTGALVTNVAWAVDKGEGTLSSDMLSWSGNATSVRFTASGATYLDAIAVTTAPANESTVTPEADVYTEVQNLAAFNALADGTLAKVTLTNAVVSAISQWAYYVQDATAGVQTYCMPFSLSAGDVLNGVIYATKSNQTAGSRMAMAELTSADDYELTTGGTPEAITSTKVADVAVQDNTNRLVKLTAVGVKGTSATAATVTDADGATIDLDNATGLWKPNAIGESLAELDYSKAVVSGVLYKKNATTFAIYPLSIDKDTATGISHIAATPGELSIYNLQGQKLQQLHKGLNIVGGKKLMVK